MIKVLFLQHGLGFGGATKSLLLMQKALKDDIECYTVLCRTKKISQDIKKEFIHTKEFVTMDIPSVYSYSEGTMKMKEFEKNKFFHPGELIKYINEKKIDIIHINSTVFSNIVRHIKENTSCKIVVHLREMLPYGTLKVIDKYIIENYCTYADAIISISDNECRYFSKFRNLFIIPNPHDFDATDPLLIKELSDKASINIGMCSNFKPVKGHLCFLDAAKIINNKIIGSNINLEFWVIGYPKKVKSIKEIAKRILSYGYKSEFDKKVKNLKIRNIRILPFTFDIYRELINIDIYVRPDISGNPWGRDIIEAMALKKPVVATGDSEFFIKNGKTGFLVPPKDPQVMSEKIIGLINDNNKRLEMGINGYNIIKNVCNMSSYKDNVLEVYSSLINEI